MSETVPLRQRLASLSVRLVALWVISVALFKLFAGTPGDLPPPVRAFLADALSNELKFKLAIAIELAISFVALVRPRVGWALQVPLLGFFVGLLAVMIQAGETSCGCFGGALKMSPWTMLAIDGAGLAAILLTRPWAAIPPGPPRLGLALPLVALAVAAPFVVLRGSAPTEAVRGEDGVWQLPDPLPRYAELDPEAQDWVGKPIRDTELGIWMDTDLYDQNTTWILYRVTCDHCATELARLASEWDGETLYVLVRLSEKDEEEFRQVDAEQLPPHHPEAILPVEVDWVCETPVTLRVEDGIVVEAHGFEGE